MPFWSDFHHAYVPWDPAGDTNWNRSIKGNIYRRRAGVLAIIKPLGADRYTLGTARLDENGSAIVGTWNWTDGLRTETDAIERAEREIDFYSTSTA